MNCNDCNCNTNSSGAALNNSICMRADTASMSVTRQLEPVLVAKIYNQPIIQEFPGSVTSLTLDNIATVTNAYTDPKSINGCFTDSYNSISNDTYRNIYSDLYTNNGMNNAVNFNDGDLTTANDSNMSINNYINY